MSTATSAGVDYTVPPNINGSGASNNHGAAARVGTSSSNFDNVAVSRTQAELYGSTVIDGTDTDEALSASTIAYNNSKIFIIICYSIVPLTEVTLFPAP